MRKIKSNFFISLDGVVATFPADEPRIPLELVSAETFKTGVLSLSYAPIKD
jgi:hypothetical protein